MVSSSTLGKDQYNQGVVRPSGKVCSLFRSGCIGRHLLGDTPEAVSGGLALR